MCAYGCLHGNAGTHEGRKEGIGSADAGVTGGSEPLDINAGKTGVAGTVRAFNC